MANENSIGQLSCLNHFRIGVKKSKARPVVGAAPVFFNITERVEMKVLDLVMIAIFLFTAIEARGKRPKPKPKWVTIEPF